ncbi:MAG: DUF5103 domain-containing protein [Bacteroidales bacterium]|nr:DUF5103 domain-containing protein [Bacteroidales bacterium]
MKSCHRIIVLTSLLFVQATVFSDEFPFDFEDKIYQETVQTVVLYPEDDPLSYPLIQLHEPELLQLKFDVLGDMAYVYQYTIVHCTFDWKPSNLRAIEYIEGFEDDRILDYRFSLNTLTPYVHYDFKFPTSYLKPILSGNYLLVVYDGQLTSETVLFTKRFMVSDPVVGIQASIPQHPRNPAYTNTAQQLDVEIHAAGFFTGKPMQAFQLVMMQNSRWDNIKSGLRPSHTYTDKLTYEYMDETVFEAANQWRNFDMKSFKYQSERIERIFVEPEYYTVRLWADQSRIRKAHLSEPDLFGRKLIQARHDQDTDIEGDYAWVEFFLNYEAPLTHGEIYVIGALNDGLINRTNRMAYNYKLKGYQLSLFLKQGYYNYLYAIREPEQSFASTELTEGNHWDTQNEYLILFYYNQPGTAYDQLIGHKIIFSH